MGMKPMNNDGVFVKLGSNTVTNYTVDYRNESITFATAPASGQVLSIVVVGESATKIPDINNFVADGSTNTFVTNVTWVDNATHFVNTPTENHILNIVPKLIAHTVTMLD